MSLGQTRVRVVQAGAMFAAFALIAGCGSQYRPVVTPINPSGPAAQPSSLAIVVSAGNGKAGQATVIDYSGDTIMATAPIGPGPISFTLDQSGSTGYTVNSDGTLTNFPSTTSLHFDKVSNSTLPAKSQPIGLFSPSAGLWAADLNGNAVDSLTGVPETLNLTIPVATTPVTVIGPGSIGQRNYAISQNSSDAPANGVPLIPLDMTCNTPALFSNLRTNHQVGEADAIEVSSHTVSAKIPLGVCPVYGVVGSDNKRIFVLNRGDDTITVINSEKNTLDGTFDSARKCVPFTSQTGQTVTCHQTLPLSTNAITATGITPPNCILATDPTCGGMPTTAGPVYAEYNATKGLLVVADYDGAAISIIDVSLDIYGNDSPTFGTTFTVPVGLYPAPYPASVTVLADGTRAYTANQSEQTVSVVNLSSHTVEKTIPGITGHPRTVVSTANSLYGKVYVSSPDSNTLTIIRTDQDILDVAVPVSGNIVDVRVTTQNGSTGNSNNNSRIPGYGQPCYLPPGLEPNPTGTQTALQVCQTLPVAP